MNRTLRHFRIWSGVRVVGDSLAGLASFYLAFLIRIYLPIPFTADLLPGERLQWFVSEWPVILVSQILVLYFFGFLDPPQPRPRLELTRRLIAATTFQILAVMGYYFLLERGFPRSVLVLFLPLNFALLLTWRVRLQRFLRFPERSVAIVGCGPAAEEIAHNINLHHAHGLRVAGFVPTPGDRLPEQPSKELGSCLGSVEDLPGLLAAGRFDDIILAGRGDDWQTQLLDQLSRVRPAHSSLLLVPSPFESLIGRMRYRWVHDTPLIEVVRESEWSLNWPLKRLMDLTLGSLLLVLAAPLIIGSALAVRLSSRGPILHRQVRIGRGHRPFTMWKLRTMRENAEEHSGEVLATPEDPRLTPVGALLRRTRLDELPQLFNILQGSMSLVGPRPERPGFVQRYLKEVPGYVERFSIAPGLTGLAQINGEYDSSPQNKLRYDLAYISNWSLWLDFSILFRTVKIVLTSRGV